MEDRAVVHIGRRVVAGLVLACAGVGAVAAKGSAGMEGQVCDCGRDDAKEAPVVHKQGCENSVAKALEGSPIASPR